MRRAWHLGQLRLQQLALDVRAHGQDHHGVRDRARADRAVDFRDGREHMAAVGIAALEDGFATGPGQLLAGAGVCKLVAVGHIIRMVSTPALPGGLG